MDCDRSSPIRTPFDPQYQVLYFRRQICSFAVEKGVEILSSVNAKGCVMAQDQSDPYTLRDGVDYYWEGERVVFTAHFLTKRGRCCDTGCRHCPYKAKPVEVVIAPAMIDKAAAAQK